MRALLLRLSAALICCLYVHADQVDPTHLRTEAGISMNDGLDYLASVQGPKGGWNEDLGPPITALVVKAFAQSEKFGRNHEITRRGLEFIRTYAKDDGGIYHEGFNNYSTSVCLMALVAAGDPADNERIADAQNYLRRLQWDEGEGIEMENDWYGGAGYGRGQRPDLSNLQLMLDALHDSGVSHDDPAFERAMVFITRCQNLGRTNTDQAWARGVQDGGFVYTCANGGESKAGDENADDGTKHLRSYGAMTYAGFKSMLYAGLNRNDPRVVAARKWISRHYDLSQNPNMDQQGLYYYYHTFARALNASGDAVITDGKGQDHNWAADLCGALIERQREDGSWVNLQDRWMEGSVDLVTAYCILALQEALR